jgi:hypothetical protein
MTMLIQEKVIAYADGNRIFYVSIDSDKLFHYRWSNGEELSKEQINFYCKQISAIQDRLEIMKDFQDRGYGRMYYYSTLDKYGTGHNATSYVKYYYPYGKPPDGNCIIRTKPNLIK